MKGEGAQQAYDVVWDSLVRLDEGGLTRDRRDHEPVNTSTGLVDFTLANHPLERGSGYAIASQVTRSDDSRFLEDALESFFFNCLASLHVTTPRHLSISADVL